MARLICVSKPMPGLKQADFAEDRVLLVLHPVVGDSEFLNFLRLASKPLDHLHALNIFRQCQNHLVAEFAIMPICRPN